MSDLTSKTCPKIKQIKSKVLETSIETIGLSQEIDDLLNLGIAFCELNFEIKGITSLHTLLTITREKGNLLTKKLDQYSIELVNLK